MSAHALHLHIQPSFSIHARLLSQVVVDEAHVYRGVFGCHTALVLRRLRRLCNHLYHSAPRFVFTSATVANPRQLAETLLGVGPAAWGASTGGGSGGTGGCGGTGGSGGSGGSGGTGGSGGSGGSGAERVVLVGPERDGSPCGVRRFVLWNPPLTARAVAAAAEAAGGVAAGGAGSAAGGGDGAAGSLTAMSRTEARSRARVTRNAQRAAARQVGPPQCPACYAFLSRSFCLCGLFLLPNRAMLAARTHVCLSSFSRLCSSVSPATCTQPLAFLQAMLEARTARARAAQLASERLAISAEAVQVRYCAILNTVSCNCAPHDWEG
jgi:hypothetical protein